MYATNNKVVLFVERDVTIEEARTGRIVATSDDGTRATVEVRIGLTVVYCGCIIDKDKNVVAFIRSWASKVEAVDE